MTQFARPAYAVQRWRIYERPVDPLLPGDRVDGATVGAYAFDGELEYPIEDGDTVLWEEQKGLPSLPLGRVSLVETQRRVEAGGVEWVRTGRVAPVPLEDQGRVVPVEKVGAKVARAFDTLLARETWPSAIGCEVRYFPPVMAAVRAAGYQVWVVGGAVRDILCGQIASKVHDVDLAGSSPPGAFCGQAHRTFERLGLGDLRLKISRASLVCWMVPPGKRKRRLEYKPLFDPHFPVPACGTSFAVDVATRDLSVNSLFYDDHHRVLLDPTGEGIGDLREHRLRTPNTSTEPVEQANVVFRSLKLLLKWDKFAVDASLLREWLASLPADVTPEPRESAVRYWKALEDFGEPDVDRSAADLGTLALRLVTEARNGAQD